MSLSRRQIENGCAVLKAVQERAHHRNWSRKRARRMARMAIQCCLTESALHNYGNVGITASRQYADPVPEPLRFELGPLYMGSDHDSVGVFQQRTPSWGTVADCMNPKIACFKFMNRAQAVGVDNFCGLYPRLAIQRVQVSFDSSGWNYGRNRLRAVAFVWRHWNYRTRSVK